MPDEVLHDDKYFVKFNLELPEIAPGKPNRFNGLNYSTLDEHKTSFDLRTIRNIIVKQNKPSGDDSSIYEMFNRLNTGGINLKPQEIRTSLYHSAFYDMLYRVNTEAGWRVLLGIQEPDLHMKDVEILLRGFAMLLEGENYNPSMTKFLNQFSKAAKGFSEEKSAYLASLFESFVAQCKGLPKQALFSKSGKFSLPVFESVFVATCAQPLANGELLANPVRPELVAKLKADEAFVAASQAQTTNRANVSARLQRAKAIFNEA
jgi:hypothetical protein